MPYRQRSPAPGCLCRFRRGADRCVQGSPGGTGHNESAHLPWACGAHLNGTYPATNNTAEAMALMTAVLLADPAGTDLTVKLDSMVVKAAWETFSTTRSERDRRRSAWRAIFTETEARRDQSNGGLTLALEHVQAHVKPITTVDHMGNALADRAAKHLRVRGVHEGEALDLRDVDGRYAPITSKAHDEPGRHVVGDVRGAIKDANGRKRRAHITRPESTQFAAGRGFTEGVAEAEQRNEAALTQNEKDLRFVAAGRRLVDTVAKARRGGSPISAALQEFMLRLITGTLYTLVAFDAWLDHKLPKMHKIGRADSRFEYTRGAWDDFEGGPDAGATFSTKCPLCGGNEDDTQGHFVTCEALREKWKEGTERAVRTAWRATRYKGPGKDTEAEEADGAARRDTEEEVVSEVTTALLRPDAHYTRRCGLVYGGAIGAVLGGIDGAGKEGSGRFISAIRIELLRSAAGVFSSRQDSLLSRETPSVGCKRVGE